MALPYHALSHSMGLCSCGEVEKEKLDLFQPLHALMRDLGLFMQILHQYAYVGVLPSQTLARGNQDPASTLLTKLLIKFAPFFISADVNLAFSLS